MPKTSDRPGWRRPRIRRRLARLGRRSATATAAWVVPDNNPFLQRAIRTETREHKPLLTLGIVVSCVILLLGLTQLFKNAIGDNLRPMTALFGEWPAVLGGDAIGFAALTTVAVCAYTALLATRARAAYLLRREVLASTMEQLQLMPVAEERWLWQMSAYPAGLALLIGLCGLPIYLMAIMNSRWTWMDLPGLAILFAAIGCVAPSWQPRVWQQKGAPPSVPAGELWKRARARASSKTLTDVERRELIRRKQRELSGAVAAVDAGDTSSAAKPNAFGFGWNRQGRGNRQAGNIVQFYFLFNFLMGLAGFSRTLGSIPLRVWQSLVGDLPASVTTLAPAFPLTWPLLLERTLFAPLPCFAFALAPILIVGPLWLATRARANLALASQISQAEVFWTPLRLRRDHLLWSFLVSSWAILLVGFGWQPLIEKGYLAAVLAGSAPSTGLAIAVAWTVACVIGAVVASVVAGKQFVLAASDIEAQKQAWVSAIQAAGVSLGLTVFLYFGACRLGGESGVSFDWQQRCLPVLATTGSFLFAMFAFSALQSALPEWRGLVRTPRYLLYWAPILGAAAMLVFRPSPLGASLDAVPYAMASPLVSLAALFRTDLWRATAPWWWGPAFQMAVGLPCLTLAVRTVFLARPQEHHASFKGPSWLAKLALALWRWVALPFVILFWPLKMILRRFTMWEESLVARCASVENPVLAAKLKSRLAREHWMVQALFVALISIVLIFGIELLNMPPWTSSGLAYAWHDLSSANGHNYLVATILFLWLMSMLTPIFVVGNAFDRDRANGTLVFLYLTPMTDAEILMGNALTGTFHTLALCAGMLPAIGLLAIARLGGGSFDGCADAVLGIVFSAAYAASSNAIAILCATRAKKPTQGSTNAILGVLGIGGGTAILWSIWPADASLYDNLAPLAFHVVCQLIIAAAAWQWTLHSFRHRRFGDVAITGSIVG